MAMNFAKLDFAVSFNPATAFPLDARTYFESLSAAEAAANSAVDAGSSDGIYYIGQTLTVVEGDAASFYIIQPDKTLKAVGSKIQIDENQFAYTEDNKLVLKDTADAEEGQVLAMSAGGALAWVTPVDAYSKTETDAKIAAAAHLKRKIVNSVDEINKDAEDADQYIYMVLKENALGEDHYDEYMVIEIADTKFVEKVGNWSVDLSDYVKKNGTDRLITEEEAAKIAESEKNVIASASSDFTIGEDRQLSLNDIAVSKVIGLQTALDKKVDAQEGYRLLNPTDIEKLDKLTVGDSGNLEVSGSVNASNVKELDTWIGNNKNSTDGLFSDSAKAKLEALFDQTSAEFEIVTIGGEGEEQKKQLNLVSVSQDKVTGLADALGVLATKTEVTNLEETLNAKFALKIDLEEIRDCLVWKDLTE